MMISLQNFNGNLSFIIISNLYVERLPVIFVVIEKSRFLRFFCELSK